MDDQMSRELNTLAAAFALDALPLDERSAFEEQLSEYPELEREVEELQQAAGLLAEPIAVRVPAALRVSVLAGIAGIRQLPPLVVDGAAPGSTPAPEVGAGPVAEISRPAGEAGAPVSDLGAHRARRARRLSGPRRTFVTAVAAAAAAAAVILGYQAVRPASSSPIAGVLAQPDARTTQVAVGHTGEAILAWSETEKRVVVQVNSLPDAPAGKTYQLWLIRSTGAVSEGTFDPTSGSATLQADGLRAGDRVGITIEPAGGSKQPTTTPILRTQLT
jgi:anti-sigma-K factor RskA